MVFIYHRLKKPSIFDFEGIPHYLRRLIFYIKQRIFPNINLKTIKEAEEPIKVTSTIPGPKGKGALNNLALFSLDYKNRLLFAHPEKSFLNYFVDADGNTILDLNAVGIPLGYNHPNLIKYSQSDISVLFTSNNYSSSPSKISEEIINLIADVKHEIKTGDLLNYLPCRNIDSNLYSLISINPIYNTRREKNIILRLSDLSSYETDKILEFLDKNKDSILGFIVEPFLNSKMQGHLYLDSNFGQLVQTFCNKNSIAFIVDETSSHLNSGKIFGFEHWNLSREPDFVILRSDSNINSGILTNKNNSVYVNSNEDFKLHTDQLDFSLEVLKYVKQERLLSKQLETGGYVLSKLNEVKDLKKNKIKNIRGLGNYQTFDFGTTEDRNNLVNHFINSGVNIQGSGERSITLRSTLLIESKQYNSFFHALNNYNH